MILMDPAFAALAPELPLVPEPPGRLKFAVASPAAPVTPSGTGPASGPLTLIV